MDNKSSNSLTYGITPGAPSSIKPVDIEKWKSGVSPTFKNYFQEKYDEIVRQYEELVKEYHINKLLYESEINFEPVIGKIYYLYERSNGTRFISMLSYEETKWSGYVGKFRLKAQYSWEEL